MLFLYATGFSAIPVEYLTKKLLVLGIKCIYSNGMDFQLRVFENNLEDMEMLVVVSRSGETKWVADRVKTAAENGIYTVSFTNEAKNRVSSLTNMQFRIEDSNKLDDRNMMANTFFPNVIMLMELLIYEYHKVQQNMDEKKNKGSSGPDICFKKADIRAFLGYLLQTCITRFLFEAKVYTRIRLLDIINV